MISNDPKQPTQVTSALVLSTGPQKVSNPEFGYVDNTLVISHSSASFTAGKKDWVTITGQKVSAMLPGIGQATAAMVGKVNVMALGAGDMWIGGSLVYHAAKDGKTHAFDVADYDVHVTVAGPSTGAGSEPSATETPAPAVTPGGNRPAQNGLRHEPLATTGRCGQSLSRLSGVRPLPVWLCS